MANKKETDQKARGAVDIARSNIKSVFGAGVGRLSVILLGVVLLLMAAYGASRLFAKPKLPAESGGGSAVGHVRAKEHDHMVPVSTEEGRKRAQAHAENAVDAKNQGQAYIAPPVITDKQLDNVSGHVANKPQEVAPAVNVAQQEPVIQETKTEIDPDRQKAVMEQVAAVINSAKSTQGGFQTFRTIFPDPVNEERQQRQEPSPQSAQQMTVPVGGGKPIVSDAGSGGNSVNEGIAATGDTCYATLDNGISSDDTSIVLATIHSCAFEPSERLHQARLVGRLEKAQDQIRVTFDRLRLAGVRKTFPVNAIAVTEDEARSGIGKDVNRHYFSRYFSLGLASLLTGYGRAAQIGGGSTIITPGSTVIQTEPMTTKRQTSIALGEMGQELGNEIKRDFNRPTTISAPRGMGIGVIFVSDADIGKEK